MTSRRSFVRTAGLAGIFAAGSAPAIVSAQPTIRWRLASSFPQALDGLYGAAEDFSESLAQATGGRFTVTIHAAGELVPAFSVLDATQSGTVECAHSAPYYFYGKSPIFALDCAIPFGMNSRQLTAWMYQGNGLNLMREFYATYNVVNFPMGNTGAQMGGWFRNEFKSVDDLQGLKMRMGGFSGYVFSKLGVIPQTLPAGEVYSALERGSLDATEFVGPYDDLRLGLYNVAPYYYYPAWWEGSAQLSLYINQDAWASLSAEDQQLVRLAASDAHVKMQAHYDAHNPTALKKLIAAGAKLVRMPRDIMDAAFQASREVYAELNDTNPTWKRIHSDYSAFLRDQYQWESVAEANYNQYMTAQKL